MPTDIETQPAIDISTGNILIIGDSGTGKSALAKQLLTKAVEDAVPAYVIDTEGEHSRLIQHLGGQVIAPRINPMRLSAPPKRHFSAPQERTARFLMECSRDRDTPISLNQLLIALSQYYTTQLENGPHQQAIGTAGIEHLIEFCRQDDADHQNLAAVTHWYDTLDEATQLTVSASDTDLTFPNAPAISLDFREIPPHTKSAGQHALAKTCLDRLTEQAQDNNPAVILIEEIGLFTHETTSQKWVQELWNKSQEHGTTFIGVSQDLHNAMYQWPRAAEQISCIESLLDQSAHVVLRRTCHPLPTRMQQILEISTQRAESTTRLTNNEMLVITHTPGTGFENRTIRHRPFAINQANLIESF